MRLILLAPRGTSGGATLYNRRMVAALRDLGHDAKLEELAGHYPSAAPDPVDAGLFGSIPADATVLLDALAFGTLPALERQHCVGLVHHPSPLHADTPDRGRDALRDAEAAALAALPRLVATSAFCAERLLTEYGVPPAKLAMVAPGVDDAPRRLPTGIGPCQLLTLGPLVPRRQHDILLAALARLTDLDWRLILIGTPDRDPACTASLHALAETSGIAPRITFAGADTPIPWAHTDILALAHPVSGLSGALAEALKRGITLALCTPDLSLCLAGAGAICPPGDIATLSKALRRMIFDPVLRAGMADSAYQAGRLLPSWAQQAHRLAEAVSEAGTG